MTISKHLPADVLYKAPTGIQGFDQITDGGLPAGRPTLVCGSPGCGKTLFAMEFIVRGATQFNEPGVFMSFEETENELATNVSSLGFNLKKLVAQKKIYMDHVQVERNEIEETGEYDLEGLFIRLNNAIETVGAKRVVLDTVESLFAGLPNKMILRSELRRLFKWLKSKNVTVIITGEKGDGDLTREGMEEYVSDCVIVLDHRVVDQVSTRMMRVVKYRGSSHGTNEYPFLIDKDGFSVLPITSLKLEHDVSGERISSGVTDLDAMLDGKGFYKGSTILVSGTAGTGKSSLAAHFTDSSCRRGERILYFAFEESPKQIIRNMRSIGIDLQPWIDKGLLGFHATRPTFHGLEMHLAIMHREIEKFKPDSVVIDPLNSLATSRNEIESKAVAMKMIDYLKSNLITGFCTSLTSSGEIQEHSSIFISSLIDTWILLRDLEVNGERNRGLYILKSRGTAHSKQIREFLITGNGIKLQRVYEGLDGVLTGSARLAREIMVDHDKQKKSHELKRKQMALERKRKAAEAEITAIKLGFEAEEAEILGAIRLDELQLNGMGKDQKKMASIRKDKNKS